MTDLMSLLQQWVPRQRWYVGGGSAAAEGGQGTQRAPGSHAASGAALELVGSYSLVDPQPEADVRFISVAILRERPRAGQQPGQGPTGAPPATYQVPLVIRNVDSDMDARGYVGTYDTGSGAAAVIDGVHDPAFARAVLSLIEREQAAPGPGGAADAIAYGLPMPGARAGRVHVARALQGEQSNSSIVLDMRDADDPETESAPLIVKIFRTLHHGENPDVTLQSALAAAGSLRVPPALGHVTGEWPDPSVAGGRARGHLAFAQEFFAGVEDAWRVARRAAETGESFAGAAQALGAATAETHEVLRSHLAVAPTSAADANRIVDEMCGRLGQALELVPDLRPHRIAIERVYDAALTARWPNRQRIHGDFHLGQVLAVPERGWVLLDFEGEPLRPLAERNALDLPVRDVAGMLRSFDYVAGALELAAGHDVAGDWATQARDAFVRGYNERAAADARAGLSMYGRPAVGSGAGQAADATNVTGPDPRILAAYELDKAVYEAVYEATHRREWLPIPLRAIARLLPR